MSQTPHPFPRSQPSDHKQQGGVAPEHGMPIHDEPSRRKMGDETFLLRTLMHDLSLIGLVREDADASSRGCW